MMTARQQLAEAILNARMKRGLTQRNIADRCSASIAEVEAWERGTAIPPSRQWHSLINGVHRDLIRHKETRQRAFDEQRAELEQRKMQQPTSPTVPLTHQPLATLRLVDAPSSTKHTPDSPTSTPPAPEPAPAPEPVADPSARAQAVGQPFRGFASDGRKLQPIRPRGAHTREAVAERERFAQGLLMQRPHASLLGPDGINKIVQQRFGIGIDTQKLRQMQLAILETLPKPEPEPKVAPSERQAIPVVTATSAPRDSQADLRAAVQLVLEAIPNLSSFTLTVSETGEASVEYKTREVKVVEAAGSMTVRR